MSEPLVNNYPTSANDAVSNAVPVNNFSTTLAADITASSTTIQLTSAGLAPNQGIGTLIDDLDNPTQVEILKWDSKSGNNLILSSTSLRGVDGTSAASFSGGAYFDARPVALHYAYHSARLDAIETKLGIGAAIAYNKLAALTASRAIVSDGSGFLSASSITATELGHLSGVTSGIQAQLNAKQAAFTSQTANTIYAGPTTGSAASPAFRALVAADIPDLSSVYEAANANIQAHIADTANPHAVTKSQVGLGNVENTALSTWAGSTNVTTLGTIVAGVWNATAIAFNKIAITGTPDGTKFVRDDGTFQNIPGGGDALTSNPLSQFAATTSAQLAGVLSDETGFSTGALAVFSKSPVIETPTIASFTNATHDHSNAAGGGTISAANLTGTLADARLTANVALLDTPQSFSAAKTFTNTGLLILDTNASHTLALKPGSDLTANRTLTITTGDADRTLTISASATLNGGTHSGTNTGDAGTVNSGTDKRFAFYSGSGTTLDDAAGVEYQSGAAPNVKISAQGGFSAFQILESGATATPEVGEIPALQTLSVVNHSTYWALAYTNDATTIGVGNYLTNSGQLAFTVWDGTTPKADFAFEPNGRFSIIPAVGGTLWIDVTAVHTAINEHIGNPLLFQILDIEAMRLNGTEAQFTVAPVSKTAAGVSLGSVSLPFKYAFLAGDSGTPASNNFKLTGTATAARTITFPDASITVARTDAAQTFTGVQTMTTPSFTTGFTIGGTAATGTIPRGNGTNFVASSFTMAAPGTSGNVLTSDGTNWTSAAPTGGGSLTVGTSAITSGSGGRLLYETSGNVLGEISTLTSDGTIVTLAATVTTGTGATSGLNATANSLTTGNAFTFSSSSVTTGNVVAMTSTSTAAGSNTQTVLNVSTSGANGTSTQTTFGAQFSNTHTGTSSTNIAAQFSASGGSANVGIKVTGGQIFSTVNGALSSGDGPAMLLNGTWITGGTATTTKPYVLIEPSGTTSTGWSTAGTALGVNAASGFTGLLFDGQVNGAHRAKITASGSFQAGGANQGFQFTSNAASLQFYSNGTNTIAAYITDDIFYIISAGLDMVSGKTLTWNGDLTLRRVGAANLAFGATNAASPVNQKISTQGSRGGTDSNVAGANLTITSGLGTGNAAPSSLILRSPLIGSSGTTAQTETTGLTILNGAAVLSVYTVATLPSASTCGQGALAFVTDANTTAILGLGTTAVGGGSNKVIVYSDATNWIVI